MLDLPGHGHTAPNLKDLGKGIPKFPVLVDCIEAFVTHVLGSAEDHALPFFLFGHSWGGALTFLASLRPSIAAVLATGPVDAVQVRSLVGLAIAARGDFKKKINPVALCGIPSSDSCALSLTLPRSLHASTQTTDAQCNVLWLLLLLTHTFCTADPTEIGRRRARRHSLSSSIPCQRELAVPQALLGVLPRGGQCHVDDCAIPFVSRGKERRSDVLCRAEPGH